MHPFSEDVWVKSAHSSSPHHLLQPSNAHIQETTSRGDIHTMEVWVPLCCTLAHSCLGQEATPADMDRCQQGDFWQCQNRFSLLLCYPFLCLHHGDFLGSFYTSQVESVFVSKRLLIFPWLLYSLTSVFGFLPL